MRAAVPSDGKGGRPPRRSHRQVGRMEVLTWRLLCSSFLVMTCFLIGDYKILPKKELHRSLQVASVLLPWAPISLIFTFVAVV